MNTININNIVKYILMTVVVLIGILGYVQMLNNDLTYLTLFELYSSKDVFNIFFAINKESFLLLTLFPLMLLAPYKVKNAIPYIILSFLLVLTTSPYLVTFLAYILLATSNDQLGKKNFFNTAISIGAILLVTKFFELDTSIVLPIGLVFLRTIMRKVSLIYDIIILFLCISFFEFNIFEPLYLNIIFVMVYIISLIKNRKLDILPLVAYWCLFNALPVVVTISIFALYIIKFNYKYFKHSELVQQGLSVVQLILCALVIYLTGMEELRFLFPFLALIVFMSSESLREVSNDI